MTQPLPSVRTSTARIRDGRTGNSLPWRWEGRWEALIQTGQQMCSPAGSKVDAIGLAHVFSGCSGVSLVIETQRG